MQTELTSPAAPVATRRVLIVDDDRDFADSVARLLAPRGYRTVTASAPDQALQLLESHDAEVALIDIRLGREDGLHLLEDLRAARPDLLCVMVTAFADLDTAIEAIQKGAYDYLRKPVSPPELFAALERCFDRLRLERERAHLETQLRQTQKLEAVGRLAGGVAHDFNNALTAILANVEIARTSLTNTGGDETALKSLDGIESTIRHASHLTRQLLTFCRNQPVRYEAVSVNDAVSDVKEMIHRLVGDKVRFQMQFDADLPAVHADAGQIGQIVTNLVVNARDATPDGGIITVTTHRAEIDRIAADVHPDARPGRYVAITVSDNGRGMSPEILDKIFEPFFTTKQPDEGTGLGLATVYGIARKCHGFVTVVSEAGRGATFTVYLPAIDVSNTQSTPNAAAQKTSAGGETILLCEDDDAIRDLLQQTLRAHGYQVLSAANGAAALELATRHDGSIDLLLTDITMPGIDGWELARRLRENQPGLRVAYTSGYTSEPGTISHEERKRTRFFVKPYTPRVLIQQLRELLDQPD